jgi:regulator of nucleoside diphosphate kinase
MKSIYISTDDYKRLRLLATTLAARKGHAAAAAGKLLHELDRAIMLADHELPPRVVRIGSHVTIEDLESGERDAYILTWPDQADADEGRLSILAPIGTAVLGYAEGDELEWDTPGGLRRLRIQTVEPSHLTAARTLVESAS